MDGVKRGGRLKLLEVDTPGHTALGTLDTGSAISLNSLPASPGLSQPALDHLENSSAPLWT